MGSTRRSFLGQCFAGAMIGAIDLSKAAELANAAPVAPVKPSPAWPCPLSVMPLSVMLANANRIGGASGYVVTVTKTGLTRIEMWGSFSNPDEWDTPIARVPRYRMVMSAFDPCPNSRCGKFRWAYEEFDE